MTISKLGNDGVSEILQLSSERYFKEVSHSKGE